MLIKFMAVYKWQRFICMKKLKAIGKEDDYI
jgi:hypothetical protein